MAHYDLARMEARFADIIWDNEPLTTRRLAELAQEALDWKRTTTYTVLKRLCDRGLFQNRDGTVTSLVSRDQFRSRKSRAFVQEAFQGSLPAFLTAFGGGKKLSEEELDALQNIIDQMRR